MKEDYLKQRIWIEEDSVSGERTKRITWTYVNLADVLDFEEYNGSLLADVDKPMITINTPHDAKIIFWDIQDFFKIYGQYKIYKKRQDGIFNGN